MDAARGTAPRRFLARSKRDGSGRRRHRVRMLPRRRRREQRTGRGRLCQQDTHHDRLAPPRLCGHGYHQGQHPLRSGKRRQPLPHRHRHRRRDAHRLHGQADSQERRQLLLPERRDRPKHQHLLLGLRGRGTEIHALHHRPHHRRAHGDWRLRQQRDCGAPHHTQGCSSRRSAGSSHRPHLRLRRRCAHGRRMLQNAGQHLRRNTAG